MKKAIVSVLLISLLLSLSAVVFAMDDDIAYIVTPVPTHIENK